MYNIITLVTKNKLIINSQVIKIVNIKNDQIHFFLIILRYKMTPYISIYI